MVPSGANEGGRTLIDMRRSAWSMPIIGLAIGSLGLVGGTAVGGNLGPLTAGYGIIVVLAALYALVGLAIRGRAWRRLSGIRGGAGVATVASHRLF
jgi:hypothetical protein